MTSTLQKKYVWWRRVLCVLGIHRLSKDWGIRGSDWSAITECEYCATRVSAVNYWAINWDWLRSQFRPEAKYDTNAFWHYLTPKWVSAFSLDTREEPIMSLSVDSGSLAEDLAKFTETLRYADLVVIERRGRFGKVKQEEIDPLRAMLLLCTK